MKNDSWCTAKRLSAVLLVALSLLISCAKEEPATEKTPPQKAVNPYSSESTFDEMKKKLVAGNAAHCAHVGIRDKNVGI